MATRLKDAISLQNTEESTGHVPANEEYLPEDIALANVLADLGSSSGAIVRIYRQGNGGYRDLTLLTECMPEEFSPMNLQNEFGGGTFRIHVRNNGQLIANQELKVAAPQVQRHQPDMISPLQSQISAIAETMRQMAEAIRAPQPQQSRAEMIQEMMLMKELFGSAPAARAADPLDQLDKIMGVHARLSELTGNAPAQKPDSMAALWDGVKTFLPVIAAAAQRNAGQPAPAAQQWQQERAQVPQVAQAEQAHQLPQQPAAQQDQEEGKEMFKYYLAMLIEKAKGNSDPTGYAHLIVDSMNDEQINMLLKPENWFENLAAVNANVLHYRDWFAELREIVFALLTEDDGTDTTAGNPEKQPEPVNAPGNPPNTNAASTA